MGRVARIQGTGWVRVVVRGRGWRWGGLSRLYLGSISALSRLYLGSISTIAGTKIVLTLKEEEKRFASRWAVEANLRKYSSFVGFPVSVDGERANTIEALWTKAKSEASNDAPAECRLGCLSAPRPSLGLGERRGARRILPLHRAGLFRPALHAALCGRRAARH